MVEPEQVVVGASPLVTPRGSEADIIWQRRYGTSPQNEAHVKKDQRVFFSLSVSVEKDLKGLLPLRRQPRRTRQPRLARREILLLFLFLLFFLFPDWESYRLQT